MTARITFIALILLSVGCGVPSAARSSRLAPAGTISFGLGFGGTFGSEQQKDAFLETVMNLGLQGSWSPSDRCEVSALISVARQDLGGRCAVIDPSNHHGVLLAPYLEVAYLPKRGANVSGGLDVGKAWDRFAPQVHLGLSYGNQFIFVPKEPTRPRHSEQSRYEARVRRELRFTPSASFGLNVMPASENRDGLRVDLLFALGPYWVLHADGEPLDWRIDGVTYSLGGRFEF